VPVTHATIGATGTANGQVQGAGGVLECVINVSEGRRGELVAAVASEAGAELLDVHIDANHNRSVLTLAGFDVEEAARAVTRAGVGALDITAHQGAHPRLGVIDVVPFVPLHPSGMPEAVEARQRYAEWASTELGLPCFLYGPERSLPEVRRGAFAAIPPDLGPPQPHPTAGAVAVGAREVLVAYNLWLADTTMDSARRLAAELRGPSVRALAFELGGETQLSFNLVEPGRLGPADIYDAVAGRARIARAELVGLVPAEVLAGVAAERWQELDLDASRTIEWRLAERAADRAAGTA
jgi:glutamate formiminotransferase